MDALNIAFLAVVQGITEFLPISSSAHLIVGRHLLAALGLAGAAMTPAEELALDIALHVGSLGAVVVYFWRDLSMLLAGLTDGVTLKGGPRFRLVLVLLVASLPIVVIAFAAKDFVTDYGRSLTIIGWTTVLFGILLYFADRQPEKKSALEDLDFREALIVGFAQAVAIIPGVSRAGICMTAGRFLGLDRPLSARLAMLLSIPTILGAGLLAALDLRASGDTALTAGALWGGLLSFLTALAAIALLMNWLKRQSYTPFIVYRLALGVLLLGLVYGGLV